MLPGWLFQKTFPSAESAIHSGDEAGRWPAMELLDALPWELPRAGMKQAVGLKVARMILSMFAFFTKDPPAIVCAIWAGIMSVKFFNALAAVAHLA